MNRLLQHFQRLNFLKPQADKIITLGKKETLQTTKMLNV